jgi:hypothetical protein
MIAAKGSSGFPESLRAGPVPEEWMEWTLPQLFLPAPEVPDISNFTWTPTVMTVRRQNLIF